MLKFWNKRVTGRGKNGFRNADLDPWGFIKTTANLNFHFSPCFVLIIDL